MHARAARSWNITLVWDSWVRSTVDAGLYLDNEADHAVQPEYVTSRLHSMLNWACA